MSLSLAERDRRYAAVRAEMAKRDVDVLLIVGRDGSDERGNHRYLTGYGIVAAYPHFVVFARDERVDPILFSPSPSARYAVASGWVTDVRRNYRPDDELLGEVARLRDGGRIGVMDTVPIRLYRALAAAHGADAIVEGRDCMMWPRLRKSAEELACARRAGIIANAAYAALEEMVRPGLTDFEIYGEMRRVIHAGGSEYSMDIIDPGDGIAAAPVGRRLGEDAVLHVELSPSVEGYFTQLRFAIPADRDAWDRELRDLRTVWQLAFDTARSSLRPGTKASEVYATTAAAVRAEGYELNHRIGHGVGLNVDEFISFDPGDDTALEPGVTLVIHPQVRHNGRFLMMGGSFAVTEGEPEPLHAPPFA